MIDAATGECLTWAYDNLPDAANAKLVHGTVHPHGGKWGDRPYPHAWIERVGRVFDWQSVVMGLGPGSRGWPRKFFYEVYQPVDVVKYNYATTRKRPWLRTAPVACALSGLGLASVNPRAELETLADEHEEYLHGRCETFAIALHRVSGLPIYGITSFDWDIEDYALVHAYVRLDQWTIVDIKGPRTYEVMLEDFDYGDDMQESPFTEREVAGIGTGSSRCPSLRQALPVAQRVWEITQQLYPAIS